MIGSLVGLILDRELVPFSVRLAILFAWLFFCGLTYCAVWITFKKRIRERSREAR